MSNKEITISLSNEGTRSEVRKRVIDIFMTEEPGTGTGVNTSKYTYYVETLQDGKRIYLTRPTWPLKGFDFVVWVEGVDFNKGEGNERYRPKHDDILEDFELKNESDPQNVFKAISSYK